jgi:phenylacetic acid degradation operon negative regulatory protein
MQPTAKSLILDLLSAADGEASPVRRIVVACALFDISENSVRVTLVRLSSAGLIEASGRGAYRLGEGAAELAGQVAAWRTAERRVRSWNGDYVSVHTGALGRGDRMALRRRTRALRLLGFRELERGLCVRPDNLEGGVDAVRTRLYTLGLEREASVFRAASFDEPREAHARSLWDGKALTGSYRRSRTQLTGWLTRAPRLEPDVAAREAFLLGGKAIRQVVFDPLLPAPLVDVEERREFVEAVRRFDRAGRAIWKRFFGFHLGSAAPSTVHVEDDPTSPGQWAH